VTAVNADGSVVCTGTGALYAAGTGLALVGTTFSVDPSTVQRRVTGTCASGAIASIGADGSVTCTGPSAGGTVLEANLYQRTAGGTSPVAQCDDANDVLLHGGCSCPNAYLWTSAPTDSVGPTTRAGWTCYAGNVGVTAYAVCLTVP
jgi:hypothetical protein